jgi:hypothetical protein
MIAALQTTVIIMGAVQEYFRHAAAAAKTYPIGPRAHLGKSIGW